MRALSTLLLAGAVGLGGLLAMPGTAAADGGWRGRHHYRGYGAPGPGYYYGGRGYYGPRVQYGGYYGPRGYYGGNYPPPPVFYRPPPPAFIPPPPVFYRPPLLAPPPAFYGGFYGVPRAYGVPRSYGIPPGPGVGLFIR